MSRCECGCERERDSASCSTCSSSTASNGSASSASSSGDDDSDESDLDDFDCDLLENHLRLYYNSKKPLNMNNLGSIKSNSNGLMSQSASSFHRKYNNGLKISYVDNLPLARTNPAPIMNNEDSIKVDKKPKSRSGSDKKRSLSSKFKRENCVVS
jgi:hypothetical protein